MKTCPFRGLFFPSALLWLLGFLAFLGSGEQARAQKPYGTDVSSYQGGGINWKTVKSDGVAFAYTKATEGTYYIDADFKINEANAKTANVPMGAYHFARPSDDPNITGATSADSEATYFWNTAGAYTVGGGHYLVPMLDWEDVYVTNAGLNFTAAKLSQWVNEWCNDVSNKIFTADALAVRPVVYTGAWYSQPGGYPGLNSSVTIWPDWIASYPSCTTGVGCGTTDPQGGAPTDTYPWSSYNVWQYGDTNWSGGDADIVNGTMSQFLSVFEIGTGAAAATSGATVYWDPNAKHASPGSGGTSSWDTYTGEWWQSGATDVAWSTSGDSAVFAGAAGTVSLINPATVAALTFNTAGYVINGDGIITLSGTTPTITVPAGSPTYLNCVVGGSGYTVSGGGVLVLENAANFSGSSSSPQIINGPNTTLVVSTDHDTGNDGVVMELENGGIYQDNDTTSGDQFLLPGCTLSLLTGGGIIDNPNASLTFSNKITGAGSLTFTGYTNASGTPYVLTLTSTANSYSGGTIVQGPGELKANAAGTLGSTTAALAVNGGILDLGAASQRVGAVTITGGTIQDGTLAGTSYAGQNGAVSAVLAGAAALTKTTGNTLTLSGANTYTGASTITAGLLQVSQDNNLGAAPALPAANQLILNNGGVSSGLRATASFTMSATRGISLTGPNGGSLQTAVGQTVTYPNVISGAGNLAIGGGYSSGYGVSILSGANTYTGSTTIAAGTLRLGRNGALPVGTPLTIAPDANSGGGGVFDLNGFSQTIGPLATSAGIGGAGTDTPTIKLTGALTVIETNINTIFSGVITGAGGRLLETGNATLTLAGSNTYTGATVVSAGTLALSAAGSINNTASVTIAAGATLDVSAMNSYNWSGSTTLTAAGAASPATIIAGSTINLGSQPMTLNYDGADPALTVAQGTLLLNGNAFTVNGPVLSPGAYTLIQQMTGVISGAGPYYVSGTAIPAGATAAVAVSGGIVILTIVDASTTAIGTLAPITYGQAASLTALVTPAVNSGTVQFFDNNTALGAPVGLSAGVAVFTANGLAAGTHPITAFYSGAPFYAASSTTSASNLVVNPAPLTVTAGPQSKPYGTATTFGSGSTNFAAWGLTNGDTIASVTLAVSGHGGAVSAPVGTYVITPCAAVGGTFLSSDYDITYAPGQLTVTLPANTIPVTIVGSALLPDGTFQLHFTGTPGYVYKIQATTNLTPPIPWVTIATNAADSNGLFNYTDWDATNYGQRFYQTMAQ